MHEDLKQRLVEKLRQIDPHKIILFGSHARGPAGPESDIDLPVVTEDDSLPRSSAEKNAIYLRFAGVIAELEKEMPIDLIAHAKTMHRKFVAMGSQSSRTIVSQGESLHEKTL
ncbi:putative nucleotidyltransferase [Geothermobacter ehrlichii]|uniref:Putative nucleotidyltransferase n=1 Tax=Geothermobacter ehrlichii TaxID=213224 RepID=A0A5D3WNL2_9BACT|nr:nucleotidyltransferase domain-containing protein [Geothermobacter ehrlichii]TYO99923.1 putative nucleotidyltransferase [Geothermobacter ehrlichii]